MLASKTLFLRSIIPSVCLAFYAMLLNGQAAEAHWKKVSENSGVTVYERVHSGSSLHEFRAVGTVDASLRAVKPVMEDVERYPEFMPFVTEARSLSSKGGSRVSYQRISPPLVGDRDYTIVVTNKSHEANGNAATTFRWKAANHLGPAEKAGVRRVQLTEGSWLLEETADGQKTQMTYTVLSDGGGGLPAFVSNWASRTAIPKIYRAIRKQVTLNSPAERK